MRQMGAVGGCSPDRPHRQRRVVLDDLLGRHPLGQAIEDDADGNAGPRHAGLAVTHEWIDRDEVDCVCCHVPTLPHPQPAATSATLIIRTLSIRFTTLTRMAPRVWTAAELEQLSPAEQDAIFAAGIVRDLADVPPEFLTRV